MAGLWIEGFDLDSFITLYAAPPELLTDSADLRFRLAKCVFRFANWNRITSEAVDTLAYELALVISSKGEFENYWTRAFTQKPLEKVLSAPTYIHAMLRDRERNGRVQVGQGTSAFLYEINRIFTEQSAAYYADENCVVHPKPDEAYRASYAHTIKGLSADNCQAARDHIAKSDACVLQDPPDWESAIYYVFKAAENLFKQITGDAQLNGKKLEQRFKPIVDAKMNDATARDKRAANRTYVGLKEWVDAAHEYRHDAGAEVIPQPREELALVLLTNGFGYVRWLAAHME